MAKPSVKPKPRRKLVLWLGFALVLAAYALYCWPWFPPWKLPSGHYPPQFTLGRDTTYFTTPLDDEGFPDYEEALNLEMARGIDPEENIVALLQQAIGPAPFGRAVPARFYEWLKIQPPPEEGAYFVAYADWIKRKNAEREREELKPLPSTFAMAATTQPWQEKDHPLVLEWLKLNERPLAIAVAASKRKQYFHPMVNPWKGDLKGRLEETPVPSVGMLFQLCDALICRSMWQAGQGKFNEALQDLQACHRLARLVRPTFSVELAIAMKIESAAMAAGLVLLEKADFSTEILQAWRKEWETLPPMASAVEILDQGERFTFLQMAIFVNQFGCDHISEIYGANDEEDAERSGSWSNISFDSFLSTVNRGIDRLVAAGRIADRGERLAALDEIESELKELRYRVYSPGHLIKIWILPRSIQGKVLGEMMGENLWNLASKQFRVVVAQADRAEETNRLFAIALALAIHRKEKGAYPAELKGLESALNPSVLEDLYSGRPHRYRKTAEGYLLYSVGLNGKDEEGRDHTADSRGDDLKVVMPMPKAERK